MEQDTTMLLSCQFDGLSKETFVQNTLLSVCACTHTGKSVFLSNHFLNCALAKQACVNNQIPECQSTPLMYQMEGAGILPGISPNLLFHFLFLGWVLTCKKSFNNLSSSFYAF